MVPNCTAPLNCFDVFLYCYRKQIFYVAIVVVSILLLIVFALVVIICCICRRLKRRSYNVGSKEDKEDINLEMKGDGFKMTKPGGEISADREKDKSKTKANDWAEDAKLENYSEAMYDTVECTTDQPSTIHQTKQTKFNTDPHAVDGDNYDIITHVEQDDCTNAGNKNSSDTKSANLKKSKEKKAEKEIVEVEYSVPDKSYKKKKQNAGKAAGTTLEQGASSSKSGGQSSSLEYNTLLHVTSSNTSTQRLSMPPPTSSEYSNITQQDTGKSKRNGSTENGRRRGRTSSSPEEPPPPLPPAFVDEENPAIKGGIQSSAQSTAVGLGINPTGGGLPLYDDPDSLVTAEPQQEMYMNVGKR